MALILLSCVVLLLVIGILLGGSGVGLLVRPTLPDSRSIGGVLTGSVRTGLAGGFSWGFLEDGILRILWGSATLLLVGGVVNVAIKFLFYSYCISY